MNSPVSGFTARAHGTFFAVAVTDVVPVAREGELLRLAAAAEAGSKHSLSRAIREAARRRALEVPGAERFEAVRRKGVEACRGGAARARGQRGVP